MQTVKFKYSAGQNYFAAIVLSVMFSFSVYFLIISISEPPVWLFAFGVLALPAMGIYFFKKFFSPFLKGETALELDEEKLQYFISGKSVCWEDIQYMDYGSNRGGGISIRFSIKESSRDFFVNTKFVAGNDNEIYKTVTEYFEKYKVDDDYTR